MRRSNRGQTLGRFLARQRLPCEYFWEKQGGGTFLGAPNDRLLIALGSPRTTGETALPIPRSEKLKVFWTGRGGQSILCSAFRKQKTPNWRAFQAISQKQMANFSAGPRLRGGEGGIRTLDTGFSPYNGLANRRLQPLGHLSAACHAYFIVHALSAFG